MTLPRRGHPAPRLPTPPPPAGHRAHIGWAAIRAAYDAHKGGAHHGQIGRRCRTCARYAAAVTTARTREQPGP